MANPDAAQRAIKNFQHKGEVDFNFDPKNAEQIKTYMHLRTFYPRITPQMLKTAMQEQKTEITQGGAMRSQYWGVPKENFPKGLPKNLKDSELPTEQLADYMVMGGANIDTEVYYIIDCEVPRPELGKNVVTFEFASKSTVRRKQNCMRALREAASSAGAAMPTPVNESEGAASAAERTHLGRSAEAPTLAIESEGAALAAERTEADRTLLGRGQDNKNGKEEDERGSLRRRSSDASETADDCNPAEKKAKTVLTTMRILKDSLAKAMQNGLWDKSSAIHQDNFTHLLDELIEVLREMKDFKPAAEVSALGSKVARWLINEILGRPMIDNVHIFKDCAIKKLVEGEIAEGSVGSEDKYCTEMIKLLESLAATPPEDIHAMPDLQLASVSNRTAFRTSVLYESFLSARVNAALSQAKEANGSARLKIVRDCKHVPGLPPSVSFTIDAVIALFTDTVSLQDRILYMLNQSSDDLRRQIVKLAVSWDPHGVVGLGAMCLDEHADLSGKPYPLFVEFAELAIKTVGGNMMCVLFVLKRYRKNKAASLRARGRS